MRSHCERNSCGVNVSQGARFETFSVVIQIEAACTLYEFPFRLHQVVHVVPVFAWSNVSGWLVIFTCTGHSIKWYPTGDLIGVRPFIETFVQCSVASGVSLYAARVLVINQQYKPPEGDAKCMEMIFEV